MIFGVGSPAEVIERCIRLSHRNYAFAGFIQPKDGLPTVAADCIAGTVDQIEEILAREKISKLVVSMTERRGTLPVKNLLTCKLRGVEIIDSPTFYEEATGKLLIEAIQPSWFIYSNGFRLTSIKQALKRVTGYYFFAGRYSCGTAISSCHRFAHQADFAGADSLQAETGRE